jgi:hypothetical protein
LILARVFSAEPCFLLRFPRADFPRSFSSSIGVPAAEVPCFPLKILDSGQIPVFFLLKAEEGVVFPLVSSEHLAQYLVSMLPVRTARVAAARARAPVSAAIFLFILPSSLVSITRPARFYVIVSTGVMQ